MSNVGRIAYLYKIDKKYSEEQRWAYKVKLNENGNYDFYYKDNIVYSISSDLVEELTIKESRFEKI